MQPERSKTFSAISKESAYSSGLRAYFMKIYNYMAGGLVLSALTAWAGIQEPLFSLFYKITPNQMISLTGLGWVAVFAPFILIFMLSSALNRLNTAAAQILFWIFSGLMGISLSNIFFIYSAASIVQALLITAGTFGAMSLYGYTTKRPLDGIGSFLRMGVFGIFIALVVNMFMHSSALYLVSSVIAVFVFTGLVAYDTQRLKMLYNEMDSPEVQQAKAISGALSLYLSIINLFQFILSLLGDRR